MEGQFYIGELPDGRFLAASNSAPAFCFRAASEEAVIEKVRKHLGAYFRFKGANPNIRITSPESTVTTLRPTKQLSVQKVLEDA